jgi:prepilin-type N-terminal cleavage/methylation domain-containing protein
MIRSPSRGGFTLIEMITVMAVIVILVSLVLSVNSAVQRKAAFSRTKAEIASMELAIKNYEVDNASPPREDATTDALDPRLHGAPSNSAQLNIYRAACLTLYKALSGDTDLDFKATEKDTGKSYASDFFRPERIKFDNPKDPSRKVEYIQDPFGNCYGYSTLGLSAEETYRQDLRVDPKSERTKDKGFNPTFDLWSTGGTNIALPTDADRVKWIKNW